MRREAGRDVGVAATCLLAALNVESRETDPEYLRALTGASILAEAAHDLHMIRKSLTTTK